MINTTLNINGKDCHIQVYQPAGAGSYHIMIDNYYCGQVVKNLNGREIALNDKGEQLLSSDDRQGILDLIIANEMYR